MVTVSDELWTEQVWTITPQPDGSVTVRGESHQQRKADSTVSSRATQRTETETAVKRRQGEVADCENTVGTTLKRDSNEIMKILLLWLTGAVATVGIGYYLVKHSGVTDSHKPNKN